MTVLSTRVSRPTQKVFACCVNYTQITKKPVIFVRIVEFMFYACSYTCITDLLYRPSNIQVATLSSKAITCIV